MKCGCRVPSKIMKCGCRLPFSIMKYGCRGSRLPSLNNEMWL